MTITKHTIAAAVTGRASLRVKRQIAAAGRRHMSGERWLRQLARLPAAHVATSRTARYAVRHARSPGVGAQLFRIVVVVVVVDLHFGRSCCTRQIVTDRVAQIARIWVHRH